MGKLFEDYKKEFEKLMESGGAPNGTSSLDSYKSVLARQEQDDFVSRGLEERRAMLAKKAAVNEAKGAYSTAADSLKKNYGKVTSELQRQRNRAEQSANINYAKLLKYLPDKLKTLGLKGVGTSSGAYVEAANEHNNTLAGISGDYSSAHADAKAAYINALSELERSKSAGLRNAETVYAQTMNDIATRYGSGAVARDDKLAAYIAAEDEAAKIEAENDALKKQAETQAALEAFSKGLADNSYQSAEDIQAAYDGFSAGLPESVKAVWDGVVEAKKAEYDAAGVIDAASVEVITDDGITFEQNKVGKWTDDTFHIKIGDKPYKIDSLGPVYETEIVKAANNVANNKFFLYGEDLYFKNDNGTVVEIDSEHHTEGYNAVMTVLMNKKAVQ